MSRRVLVMAAALAVAATLAGAPGDRGAAQDGPGQAGDALTLFSLGSGELDGGYHVAARALCDAVNRGGEGRLRCSPETTPGSRYNLNALESGELDMAIAQSDLAWKAAAAGARLRVASALYVETLALLVRRDLRFDGLRDLLGARIDIGPPASGRSATLTALIAALDLPSDAFAEVSRRTGADAVDALCAGTLDAVLLIVGHPSPLVRRALTECGARLEPFDGPQVAAAMARAPFLAPLEIAPGLYPGVDAPVPSVGVTALLMARDDTPATVVAAALDALIAPSREMMRRAPILAGADPTAVAKGFGPIAAHPALGEAFSTGP